MAQIDFSLQNRIPDGNGKLLVGDLSPTDGSYSTENQYLTWMKGKILYSGYLYNGDFYKEAAHTNVISKVDGALYVDLSDGTNLSLYYCDNTTYKPLTEEAQVQAIIDGLNDGTIVPLKAKQDQNGNVIDQTYETKAEASDLKSAIQGNTARIENLEQEHGGYVPVNYRGTDAVPTGKAKYGLVESIVGKSRAWNQPVENGDFQSDTGWSGNNCTITGVSSNIATVKITEDNVNCRIQHDVDGWILGHKYLLAMYIKTPYTQAVKIGMGNRLVGVVQSGSLTANAWNFVYGIAEAESDNVSAPNIRIFPITSTGTYQVNDEFQVKYAFSRDMTTILSDWSSSDITTANIPLMVQQIPDLLKYDAYNTGSLVSTTVSGVKSVGVNIWDEETALYGGGGNILGAKNNIPVLMGQTYHITPSIPATGTDRYYIQFLDSDGNQISDKSIYGNASDFTFTTPMGCWYLMFYIFGSYGTVYKHDIQISEVHGSVSTVNTTYHPHITDTLSLPQSVTLRSAGSVADTDELNVEVLVGGVKVNKRRQTTRVGTYTFTGNENWAYSSGRGYWFIDFSGAKGNGGGNIPNLLTSRYVPESYNGGIYGQKTGMYIDNLNVYVYDPAFVNATQAQVQQGMKDVVMNYELADKSVTLLDPIINNTIQTEGGGTINTIQTQTTVIDNSLDVGYLAL